MEDIKKAKSLVKEVLGVDATTTEDGNGISFYHLGVTYTFTSYDELSKALERLDRWLNIDCNLFDIHDRIDELYDAVHGAE